MSRDLSAAMRAGIYAEHTDESIIALLTINHPTLSEPVRVCDLPHGRLSESPLRYGCVSRSNEYDYLPFALTLAEDREGIPSKVTIAIDNIDRGLIVMIRSVDEPATATVEIALESQPDTIEAEWPIYEIITAEYDATAVVIACAIRTFHRQKFPAGNFDPARFPGLFS